MMHEIKRHLESHDIRSLFVQRLGWENAHGSTTISTRHGDVLCERIAHKRGLQVFQCELRRMDLQDRQTLREIERAIARHAHEHILVYVEPVWRHQVWQWSARTPEGHRLRHREHPFTSASPPEEFLQRLRMLEFTLQEEERVVLADVLRRTVKVLDNDADLRIFFRNSKYSRESDRLAREMLTGGKDEFHRFLLFHASFARWCAARYERLGVDREDLDQYAMIGLIRATLKFDPDNGAAFTTYAYPWVRQVCERYITNDLRKISMRSPLFWQYRRLQRQMDAHRCEGGEVAVRKYLAQACRDDHVLSRHFCDMARAMEVGSLDDPDDDAWRSDRLIPDKQHTPLESLIYRDTLALLPRCLRQLDGREMKIIRLRFGLDGHERTLKEVGDQVGLTRERVRQLMRESLATLRRLLGKYLGEPVAVGANDVDEDDALGDGPSHVLSSNSVSKRDLLSPASEFHTEEAVSL